MFLKSAWIKVDCKDFQVPARYGEQGYGQHEYVYLGPDRRKEEYEQEEEQSYGQEGRYDQNGYGYGGNSQEVKLKKKKIDRKLNILGGGSMERESRECSGKRSRGRVCEEN